jgi:TM2 domain-containing membrane protein YozV
VIDGGSVTAGNASAFRRSLCGCPESLGAAAFVVEGRPERGIELIGPAQFMSRLVDSGDTRTLISRPASTARRPLDEARQRAAGVWPDKLRISVGLEHIDDILRDIDPALGAASAFDAALPQPRPRGWTASLYRNPRRRIGGLVCFSADGTACAVPVRAWPLPWRDLLWSLLLRPPAGPLRAAWRQVFERLGLTGGEDPRRRSRAVAVALALVFGWFGAQWFYLGRPRRGWTYLMTLPLLMAPLFMSFADALRFIWVERAEFDARFVGPTCG